MCSPVQIVKKTNIQKLTVSAVMLAFCLVLPFFAGQMPEIGNMLCPMHIPVLLCGFICGWQYGLAVGLVAPLLRSFLFFSPPFFPQAVSMSVELMVYGLITGILYKKFPKKNLYIYLNLIIAMLSGRAAWGLARFIIYGLGYTEFSFGLFLSGAFVQAVPGIMIQLIVIPLVVMVLNRIKFRNFS